VTSDYLAIYLNDHLAGATVGRELSKRAAQSNEGSELGSFLERLHEEIVDDRTTLEEVMDAVGAGKDRVKTVGALAAERMGRFKPNGQLRGYSPLSRVIELEGLALGIGGKLALWRALATLADPRLGDFDFVALAERAERQQEELETHRVQAVEQAFGQAQRTP